MSSKKFVVSSLVLALVAGGTAVATPLAVLADSTPATAVSGGSLAEMVSQLTGNKVTSTPEVNLTAEEKAKADQLIDALQSQQSKFADKSVAQQLETNVEKRGKFTLAAKAAALAMKTTLKRIGPTAWQNTVKSIGLASAPWANWTAINKALDIAVNSSGTIEDALVKAGMPRWVAHAVVTVLL